MSDDRWRVLSEYYEPAEGDQRVRRPARSIDAPSRETVSPAEDLVHGQRIDRPDDDLDLVFDAVLTRILIFVRFGLMIVALVSGAVWLASQVISVLVGPSTSPGF